MPRPIPILISGWRIFVLSALLDGGEQKNPTGPIPYDADLVSRIVADAQTHGDAQRGAVVFALPTSACLSCHKVGDTGGSVGPELTKVGLCLSPAEIVESVHWPNRTVKPEFKAIAITMLNGNTLQGVVRKETAAAASR